MRKPKVLEALRRRFFFKFEFSVGRTNWVWSGDWVVFVGHPLPHPIAGQMRPERGGERLEKSLRLSTAAESTMGCEELRPIVGGFQVKRLTWGRLRRGKCLAPHFEVFLV